MKRNVTIFLFVLVLIGYELHAQTNVNADSKIMRNIVTSHIKNVSATYDFAEGAYDTLQNDYEFPPSVFNEAFQAYFEASKLVPQRPCRLFKISAAFYNYDSEFRSKDVEFYVWKDNNGLPGEIIVEKRVTIGLEADANEWIQVDVSDSGFILTEPFWVGHKELSAGPPSSLVDQTVTDAKLNYYSANGSTWFEDYFDYWHYALVDYQDEGNPDIFVKPDTLFFQVGLSSNQYMGNFNLNETRYDRYDVHVPDRLNPLPIQWKGDISTEDYDTLAYDFEQPYSTVPEEYQIIYEATKLFSPKLYQLKKLVIQFLNLNSGTASKDVKFFVWDDNDGTPGNELASIVRTVTTGSNERVWHSVDFSDFDVEVNGYFWIGHRELSTGDPTSVGDLLVTPGVNYYSDNGSFWQDAEVDFLQMALVQSIAGEEDGTVFLISNKGTGDLFVSDIIPADSWITDIAPQKFLIPAGDSRFVNVNVNSEAFGFGRYESNIHILSDDQDESDYKEPVVLNVYDQEIEEPTISITPDTLKFFVNLGSGTTVLEKEDQQILNIENIGPGDLYVNYQIANVNWVSSISPMNFVLSEGENESVTVVADASVLGTGTYDGTLSILSNDPENSVYEQPLKLIVQRQIVTKPDIVVSPDTLFFEARIDEAVTSDQATFTVFNGGDEDLVVSNISTSATWVKQLSLTSFMLTPQANQNVNIAVEIGNMSAGQYQGNLNIESNDPDTPSYLLPLKFNVLAPFPRYPNIVVSADTLSFETRKGNDPPHDTTAVFSISNDGENDLNIIDIVSSESWLESVSPANFTITPGGNQNVTLTASDRNLNEGDYFGTVTISSNDPDTPLYTILLILNVLPALPHLQVEQQQLSFEARLEDDATYDTTYIDVSNVGSGTLSVTGITTPVDYISTISPIEFTLNASDKQKVEVIASTEGLTAGEYQSYIRILSNDPDNPNYDIEFTFNVLPPAPQYPNITISTDTLHYEARMGNELPQDTTASFSINNDGDADLIITDITTTEPWVVDISKTSTTVSPGGQDFIEVKVTDDQLDVGTYTDIVTIKSNDPDTPTYHLYLELNVLEPLPRPDISVTPDTLFMEAQLAKTSKSIESLFQFDMGDITIKNNGNAVLEINTIASSDRWITSISETSFAIAPSAEKIIEITASAMNMAPGRYKGSIEISSNDPDQSIYQVPVVFTVLEPIATYPEINVNPDTLLFEARLGDVVSYDTSLFRVENSGEASLTVVNIARSTDWIESISPSAFSVAVNGSRDVEVVVKTDGLNAGVHETTISIQSNDPVNPIYALPVKFMVLPSLPKYPHIMVTPDTVRFEAQLGDVAVSDTSVIFIENLGDADLTVALITAQVSWIKSIVPADVVVAPSESKPVELIASSATIDTAGVYWGNLVIESNDPDTPVYELVLQFSVKEPVERFPNIVFSTDSIYFDLKLGGENPPDTVAIFSISNEGNAELDVTEITSNNSWYKEVSPSAFKLNPGNSRQVTLKITDRYLTPGVYYGKLRITSNDPDTPMFIIKIQINVVDIAPLITVDPDTIFFQTRMGGYSPQDTVAVFSVSNIGVSDLKVSDVFSKNSWFKEVSPTSFVLSRGDSQQVTLTVTDRYLVPGEYYGKLMFESNDPNNRTFIVRYQINVYEMPQHIAVNTDSLLFSTRKGYDPPQDTIAVFSVSNIGEEPLKINDIRSEASWLHSVEPLSFELTPGASRMVNVLVTDNDLETGLYESELHIISDDPVKPDLSILLSFNVLPVLPKPTITVNPDTVYMNATIGETVAYDSSLIIVGNTGDDTLRVSSIVWNANWITFIDPTTFEVSPGNEKSVMIIGSTKDMQQGLHYAEVTINSNDEKDPEYKVLVVMDLIISDVGYVSNQFVADSYILRQNYPNPFNPETNIQFSIPEETHVTITIYNTMGQVINKLIDTSMSAGEHHVVWNADNQNGSKVSSGIYVYELRTDKVKLIRKMVLLE